MARSAFPPKLRRATRRPPKPAAAKWNPTRRPRPSTTENLPAIGTMRPRPPAARQAHEAKLAANAAEVAAHKAAMDEYQKKLTGKASTDDDPNRCITSPAIKPGLAATPKFPSPTAAIKRSTFHLPEANDRRLAVRGQLWDALPAIDDVHVDQCDRRNLCRCGHLWQREQTGTTGGDNQIALMGRSAFRPLQTLEFA